MLILRIASRHRRIGAAGCLLLAAGVVCADEPAQAKTAPALRQQLNEVVKNITWEDRGLRSGLARLSEVYGIAILLDRRIDPGLLVSATASNQTLESFLKQVAGEANAGITAVGPVVYIGPIESTSQLSALAAARRQEIGKLSNDAKARLLHVASWQWSELAQPRQLLDELARQGRVQIENADAIPLDLWPDVSLPPLPWSDRLTLLLAGFRLTFEIDPPGTVIRLVPAPTSVATIAKSQPGSSPAETVRTAKSPKTGGKSKGGDKLYTLTVENRSANEVVTRIAKDMDKELKYEAAIGETLAGKIKLNVKDATLDYLLELTLKPLGLTYRLTDQSLEIIQRP